MNPKRPLTLMQVFQREEMDTSKAAAALGRLGGKAGRGASQVRGDSDHYRAIRAKRPKRAILTVDAVSVCCPECGEPQPCHTGSEMWTPSDFERVEGPRVCISCGQRLRIVPGDASFR